MSAKILVTGATGNFGKTTIDFLLEKGIEAANIQLWLEMNQKRKI
jgi:NAD(P)H dehydrogenase (quinone)